MGRWLAEFQENTSEMPIPSTDKTDTSHDLSVLSVRDRGVLEEKPQNPGMFLKPSITIKWVIKGVKKGSGLFSNILILHPIHPIPNSGSVFTFP